MMKAEVVEQLINLNHTFYAQLADPFARSRLTPQPGFTRLLDWLPDPCERVLDVGCGNGRFGLFLRANGVTADYAGVDFSSPFLNKAQAQQPGRFYARDLSRPGCLDGLGRFDLVVCLAVMQHIPGWANRQRLLGEMAGCLAKDGRIFLANWQFMDSPRQRRKRQDWSQIGLSQADVEANDYLLNWQRGGYGLRYVCQIDADETAVMTQAARLRLLHQFRSDGREGNLSLYSVLANATILPD
jgi:tRNA (uracil-5-)-methyltransferase TRM9